MDQVDRELDAYLRSLSPENFEKLKQDFSTHLDLDPLTSSVDVPPNSPSIRAILSGYIVDDYNYNQAYDELLLAGVSSFYIDDLLSGKLEYDGKLWIRPTLLS